MSKLPDNPPPLFGTYTYGDRLDYKLREARYFCQRVKDQHENYARRGRRWDPKARIELDRFLFLTSAFISASRSVYYYVRMGVKTSAGKAWLSEVESVPIHQIAKHIRDFMLHEAMPNTGLQASITEMPRPGESRGEYIVRGILESKPSVTIAFEEALPQLNPDAVAYLKRLPSTLALFDAILAALDDLVREAKATGHFDGAREVKPVSTKR